MALIGFLISADLPGPCLVWADSTDPEACQRVQALLLADLELQLKESARLCCVEEEPSKHRTVRHKWDIDGNVGRGRWRLRQVFAWVGRDATDTIRILDGADFTHMQPGKNGWTAVREDWGDRSVYSHGVLWRHWYPTVGGQRLDRILANAAPVWVEESGDSLRVLIPGSEAVRDGLANPEATVHGFLGWRFSFRKIEGRLRLVEMLFLVSADQLRAVTKDGEEKNFAIPGEENLEFFGKEYAATNKVTWSEFRRVQGLVIPMRYDLLVEDIHNWAAVDASSLEPVKSFPDGHFGVWAPPEWGKQGRLCDERTGDVTWFGPGDDSNADAPAPALAEQRKEDPDLCLWDVLGLVCALLALAALLLWASARRRRKRSMAESP